jgi:hypothetical protein
MKFDKLQLYGIIVSATIIFFSCIYLLEYFTGNGDGIWANYDLLKLSNKALVFQTFIFFILYGIKRWKTWFPNVCLVIVSILTTLYLFEFTVGLLIKFQSKQNIAKKGITILRPDHDKCVVFDDTLGYKAKANWYLKWNPLNDAHKLTFSTDSLSRRIVPVSDSTRTRRDKYAIFLGCSYTYGDGVSDEETMPYYFQEKALNYTAQNYGFMGYSPLQSLAIFQSRNIRKEVTGNDGFAVYTYIKDQLDRVIPASRWIELMKGQVPNLDESTMKVDGIFIKKHHILYDFIHWGVNTNLAQYFRIGYPLKHQDSHYQLVVDILKKTKEAYQKQFKNDKFFVIIFPGSPLEPSMKKMFDKSGVQYFDYSKLLDLEKNYLPYDSAHPKSEVYKQVMEVFYNDLKKREL